MLLTYTAHVTEIHKELLPGRGGNVRSYLKEFVYFRELPSGVGKLYLYISPTDAPCKIPVYLRGWVGEIDEVQFTSDDRSVLLLEERTPPYTRYVAIVFHRDVCDEGDLRMFLNGMKFAHEGQAI